MTDLDDRRHHTVTGLSISAFPGLRTTFKFLFFSRRKVKMFMFLQKFTNKLDQKYCHTLKGQEKTVNKS